MMLCALEQRLVVFSPLFLGMEQLVSRETTNQKCLLHDLNLGMR